MIRREIVLPAPREEVWEALTEPERLEDWFANDVDLDLRPGGGASFRWSNGEERHATRLLRIAHDAVPRVVPAKRQPAFRRGHDARRQRRRRSFGASPRACAAESKSAAVKPAKSSASKFGLPARRSAWAFRACSKIVRA